jgi:disulfide oxidoreductase YuzD
MMQYQLTLTFNEDTSKEAIEWLVASLKYKKHLTFEHNGFEVEAVELAVAAVEPDLSELEENYPPNYFDPPETFEEDLKEQGFDESELTGPWSD